MKSAGGDPHDLARFVRAQAGVFDAVRAELTAGLKRTHWMWFVFPQRVELGRSGAARAYGIASRAEARAYVEHPVLGPRLVECIQRLLAHATRGAQAVLGSIDALKLCSCLTLFAAVAPEQPLFARALDAFYGGRRDAATLALLGAETAG